MAKDYPTSVAQDQVLEALGMTATGYSDAAKKFEKLGLVVSSRREGRKSVPVVMVKDRIGGGFTEDGDGEEWEVYPSADLSAIEKWVQK